MNIYDLENQVAIVTGGAQGIGYAVAERLVESGATVAIWDQDQTLAKQAAESLGKGCVAFGVDVTDPDRVASVCAEVEQQVGPVSILVNSAGVAGSIAKVVDYDPAEWRSIVDVNLNGTFNCCRAVLSGFQARKFGRIVNIASIAGKEGNPNAAAYSSSKAGVIALTKSLGKEHADLDISVNCVTPAAAKTRIFDQMSQEHIDFMLSKIPRGRFLRLEEAASMIAWLCTPENSFTTGAVFDLSGGRATY
jgi:2-dehydro-3-deoxy-L-rhamnonate dehydrogenase (NAD+)